jgi:hypothetical protein
MQRRFGGNGMDCLASPKLNSILFPLYILFFLSKMASSSPPISSPMHIIDGQIQTPSDTQQDIPIPSPSSYFSSNFPRPNRPKHFGVGGGQVRILGVHSEPGSFAKEETPIEEEKSLETEQNIAEGTDYCGGNLNNREGQNRGRHKNQRQHSAMSSLYRQVVIIH